MDKERGYFIVFEGIDKCGKSTQLQMCAEALKKLGYSDIVITGEPTDAYNGPIGMLIREVLRHKMRLSAREFQIWYTADRIWHDAVIILPALARKAIVLCDRYDCSTIAYGSAFGVSSDLIAEINSGVSRPDLALLFDVDMEKIAARLNLTASPEFFEKTETLKKVLDAYINIVPRYRAMTTVNGNGTIEEIHEVVMKHVLTLIGHDAHQGKLFNGELRPFP